MKLLNIEEALDYNPFLTDRVLNHMPRWSTVPVLHRQTVGEHCFLVARYCMLLNEYYIDAPIVMEEVLKLALIHDDEELKTGDRPSPDKEDSSYDMPTIEHGLVKVADRLEAYMYVREEIHLGNKFMQPFMPPTRSRYVKVRDHFMNLYKVSIGLRDVGLEHD